jgi:hypothetical protein
LTWSHHREVAPLEPELADKLLDWVAEPVYAHGKRRRSIAELRQRIREDYRSELAGQLSLMMAAPMAPKQSYSEWGERGNWEPNPSMLAALKNLGVALDRCLLQCVPAVDVRYMIWLHFARLGDVYYGSHRARSRLMQGLPTLEEAA